MKNPVSATLQGLWQMRAPSSSIVPLAEDERLDGRVALITGANRGLGRAVATRLAERGARVILACRSGITEAAARIARESGSDQVETRHVDLADLASIDRLIAGLVSEGRKLDIVVLNAGVVPRAARPTAQGFELMFGVNYLANVALVEGLLDAGVVVPSADAPPRIVFVTSESHRGAGPIDLADLGAFRPFGAMTGMKVYGYTKLLLSTYAAHLARRLGPLASVHACCPGPVNSDIAREAPAWMKPLLRPVMRAFFRSPEDAAPPVVYLAAAHRLDGETGSYLHVLEQKPPDDECLDAAKGAALYEKSRTLLASCRNREGKRG